MLKSWKNKKSNKFAANNAFLVFTKTLVDCWKNHFFLGEILFLPVKVRENLWKLGIKQSTSVLVQLLKPHFFVKFFSKFVTFLRFFSFLHKNAENDYFHQQLGCAAPKPWWKYTAEDFLRYPEHRLGTTGQILFLSFKSSYILMLSFVG